MKMSSMVGVCSALALCLTAGMAQAGPTAGAQKHARTQKKHVYQRPTVTAAGHPTRVEPTKVAGIRKLANGKYEMTTPWMQTHGNGVGNDQGFDMIYDSAQVDDNGAPIGGTECGLPGDGYRWLLNNNCDGAKYNNPYATWWMTIDNKYAGAQAPEASLHWYWTAAGNGTYYVAVFTSEDVSQDCSLPSEDNVYDGVVLGFNDNLGSGYFYTVFDGTAYDLFWTMPSDSTGGIIEILADFFDGQTLTLAVGPAQPMLYGTSNNGGLPGRPGVSGDPTWSDDGGTCPASPDGTHSDNECYSYAFGVCPDPLTNMITFFGNAGGNQCYADCDGNGSLDIFDFLCFTNDFNSNGAYSNCDGNNSHDIFDFLCFVNAFNVGCG